MIVIIAAIGRNRELGKGNDLIWHIPDDLKRFKELTRGHPVIMGRATWESIPAKYRPLPERTNIVITRDTAYEASGAVVAHSLEEAFEKACTVRQTASGAETIFVIGGAQIYALALPYTDIMYITHVDAEDKDADTFFPEFENEFTKKLAHPERVHEGLKYQWIDYKRT